MDKKAPCKENVVAYSSSHYARAREEAAVEAAAIAAGLLDKPMSTSQESGKAQWKPSKASIDMRDTASASGNPKIRQAAWAVWSDFSRVAGLDELMTDLNGKRAANVAECFMNHRTAGGLVSVAQAATEL